MDNILILLIPWLVFLVLVLMDWILRTIERYKASKMSQAERLAYLIKKYGKNWMDYFDG